MLHTSGKGPLVIDTRPPTEYYGRNICLVLLHFSHLYCKFINFCEGLIFRYLRPSLNHKKKKKKTANLIHVPRVLKRANLTANINPCKHGFVSKKQTLIPTKIKEFTVGTLFLPHLLYTSVSSSKFVIQHDMV